MALVMPRDEFELVKRVLAVLTRDAGHDPPLPCRPALGAAVARSV